MHDALPLAVQMYTLRSLPGSFREKLQVVVEAGYAAVETVGSHGLTAEEMRDALSEHGVRVVSSHVPLESLRNDLSGVLAFAKTVGNSTLVVPYLPQEQRPVDRSGWSRLGEELGGVGARCADQGVRLLYHNHDFEMVEVDGRAAIDWLLDSARPEHLGFEPDLAWIVRGGRSPAEVLDRYEGRCSRVHVKDLAPAGRETEEGGWAAVGKGTLDWRRLIGAARTAGAEWFVVEHDLPADPARSIRESFDYLVRFSEDER